MEGSRMTQRFTVRTARWREHIFLGEKDCVSLEKSKSLVIEVGEVTQKLK